MMRGGLLMFSPPIARNRSSGETAIEPRACFNLQTLCYPRAPHLGVTALCVACTRISAHTPSSLEN
jgi:hypothetical protein